MMTGNLLDLIESLMGGHKNTPTASAARAVLVGGMTRPQAQEQYGITRATLSNAINARLRVLETARQIAAIDQSDSGSRQLSSAVRSSSS